MVVSTVVRVTNSVTLETQLPCCIVPWHFLSKSESINLLDSMYSRKESDASCNPRQ